MSIFLYEFLHFKRNKAKLFCYLFFMILCILSILNGFEKYSKQINTISQIEEKKQEDISNIIKWFENNKKGPEDRPWVDIGNPFWAIYYTPTYAYKIPSDLFPLGIGQSEQFGYYKKITRWSSTYDNDMIEEISNFERLIYGVIDFSFLVIFLLPILIIIFTYNINGLEKDLDFHKLIMNQTKNVNFWILNRLLFYFLLLIFSIDIMILCVGLINNFNQHISSIFQLVLISNLYILFFFIIFYFLIRHGKSNNNIAFKMISIWLIFCVLIPGSVHQYSNLKFPTNYMTDFLDANRKETYDVFKLENNELHNILIDLYPDLINTRLLQDKTPKNQKIRRSISSIINKMNIEAATEIELQNESKNKFIRRSYFYNPVSFVQNMWNSCTLTNYESYREFRTKIQEAITTRNELILFELWNNNKVDMSLYNNYLKTLNYE